MGFSLYLFLADTVINPFVYVFVGWGTVVAAHYLSYFFDLLKMNVLNRNFQAFVVNHEGEFWDGAKFRLENGEPEFAYNDLQINSMIKRVVKLSGENDLFVRVMPPVPITDEIGE